MTTTVWKRVLEALDEQVIEVPTGARIVHFAAQAGKFCVWYWCDPNATSEQRTIRIAGTGHPISGEGWRYIGSTFYQTDGLVFHAFERAA